MKICLINGDIRTYWQISNTHQYVWYIASSWGDWNEWSLMTEIERFRFKYRKIYVHSISMGNTIDTFVPNSTNLEQKVRLLPIKNKTVPYCKRLNSHTTYWVTSRRCHCYTYSERPLTSAITSREDLIESMYRQYFLPIISSLCPYLKSRSNRPAAPREQRFIVQIVGPWHIRSHRVPLGTCNWLHLPHGMRKLAKSNGASYMSKRW